MGFNDFKHTGTTSPTMSDRVRDVGTAGNVPSSQSQSSSLSRDSPSLNSCLFRLAGVSMVDGRGWPLSSKAGVSEGGDILADLGVAKTEIYEEQ